MKPLKVCLDARLIDWSSNGGVSSFVIGLAKGLSKLNDGNEQYYFLTYRDAQEWIIPYLTGACQILPGPLSPPQQPGWKTWIKKRLPAISYVWGALSPLAIPLLLSPAKSDGTIETAGIDVMHFTSQLAFLTHVPSIYHPHDLQHLHYPQYFPKGDIINREVLYRIFCKQAQIIAVSSSWTKRDLCEHYNLSENKVKVVPLAPAITAYPCPTETDLLMVKRKFNLPDDFIFYPAQTWEHKNHIGLLQALFILRRDHDITVPLVSSGRRTDFFPTIKKQIQELQLEEQAQFLDFVSPLELQCLYKLCRGVVLPTKFESASFPLWEAFHAGAPAACSNVTSLPEQAGDAALIFNPHRPDEMAEAILSLWTDEKLRQTLIKRGTMRVAEFSWDRTARTFRAHYRRLAGRSPTEEDRHLLTDLPLL